MGKHNIMGLDNFLLKYRIDRLKHFNLQINTVDVLFMFNNFLS